MAVKPYWEDKRAGLTIYCGDCREILPTLPKVDLVLTDPPYGVGCRYGTFIDTRENVRELVKQVIPICIERTSRTVLTCSTRQISFYPEPTWILCWLNRAGSFPNPWGFTCWQPVMCYGKDPFLEHRKGSRADVIEHSESSKRWDHPCPKPDNFWTKLLLRSSVLESDVVMDPFMGSGTTLVAAKKREGAPSESRSSGSIATLPSNGWSRL